MTLKKDELLLEELASAPATPATGKWKVYFKSDGLYIVDDAGNETGPFTEFNDAEGNPAAIGTAADGTSIYNARRDHVHAITNGSAVLASAFSITGTAGEFQDTGLAVTLPSAGTYHIHVDARTQLAGNAGSSWWLQGKLYNSTDAADVADSERMLIIFSATTRIGSTSSMDIIVTVAASKTIKLYAARNGAGSPSWTESIIPSDANGRTSMSYKKIG